jgi:hypothetical protein
MGEIRGCFIDPTAPKELKAIRGEIAWALESLYELCKRCVEAGGDYIE